MLIINIQQKAGVKFTIAEIDLLWDLLRGDAARHPLQGDILKKLFIPSELHPLADNVLRTNNSKKIELLIQAIEEKRQVILKNYHSSNSQTVRDRLIEPLEFSENYSSITAYEPEKEGQRVFRIDRIEGVELLDTLQASGLNPEGVDWFGFIGNKAFEIKLHLSDLAYNLLIEEYPMTKPYTQRLSTKSNHPYLFESQVRSEVGIGRFILSIPGEIVVESPSRLKKYLNERIKGLRF